MKLFDTNVLIVAMMPHREHHEQAIRTFKSAKDGGEAAISTHTLAELYNVLSGRLHVTPEQAFALIDRFTNDIEIVPLDQKGYMDAMRRVSSLGISGGVIFDALLAQCAVNHQCDALYTFNIKHFSRLGSDIAAIAREP
jgi:predicted nucleic acid-binding protein